jgi:hypothetical protein
MVYNYTLTTSGGNCPAVSATGTITINEVPTITLSSGTASQTVCKGAAINNFAYTVAGAGTGASISPALPAGLTSSFIGGVFTISGTPTTAMVYNYTLTTSGGNCPAVSATGTITINEVPTITLSSVVVCVGATLNLTASGANSYLWNGPSAFTSTLQNPILVNAVVGNGGIYTVSGTNTATGCTASATTSVTVNTNPSLVVSTAMTCVGATLNLTASGANSYLWNGPSAFTSTLQNPILVNAVVGNGGIYTVNGTNTATGCTASATTSVTVNTNPTLSIPNPVTFCQGSNFSITLTGTATSYTWSGPNGFTGTTAAITFNNANVSKSGIYTVIGSSTANCTASATTTITINPLPTVTALPKTVCTGSTVTMMATGANTYAWTGSNSFTATGANPNIPSTISNVAGVYTFTVVGTSNSCNASITTSLTITQTPTATASATSLTVSAGQSTTLQGGGGTSYSWSGPNSFTSTEQNPVITNFAAIKVGTYTVTATQANCTATATVALALSTCNFAVTTALTVCQGADATFMATGGDTYSWLGPNSFKEKTANPTIFSTQKTRHEGTYIVQISKGGASPCTAQYSVQLTVTNPYAFDPYIKDNNESATTCINSISLSAINCPTGATYKWYDISPENIGNENVIVGTAINFSTNILWNNPKYKLSCADNTVSGVCTAPTFERTVTSRKSPTVTIKNIIQSCVNAESVANAPTAKIKFEVRNGNATSVGFVLVNSYVPLPSSWDDAKNTFHGRTGSYPFETSKVKAVYTSGNGSTDVDYFATRSSENGLDVYTANLPVSSNPWYLVMLNNQNSCFSKSENFELYSGKPVLFETISQNNIIDCFGGFGTATVPLKSLNSLTGLYSQNQALFTAIKPSEVYVIDANRNTIPNVIKTTSVGTIPDRDYKISLADLPATTTVKEYNDACISLNNPNYNSATCEKLPRYRVEFIAGDGCKYTSPGFVVQQPSKLQLQAIASEPTCLGETIPKVDLKSQGGNVGKQFFLINGTTETAITTANFADNFTALKAHYEANPLPYKFKVKDTKGCFAMDEVTNSPMKAFSYTATIDVDNPESVSIKFSGGTKPFDYAVVPFAQTTTPTSWTSITATSGYVDGEFINAKGPFAPGKYKVYAKYGLCTQIPPFQEVTVGTKSVPEPPVVPTSAICATTVARVQEQVKCNQPFCEVKWYAAATGGTPLSLSDIITNNNIATATGNKEFYVSTAITGTDKETITRVKTTLLFIPNPIVTIANLSICEGEPTTLASLGTTNKPATLTGTMALQVTTPVPDSKIFDNLNFKPTISGEYKVAQFFKENEQSVPCPSAGTPLNITVTPAPPTPTLAQNVFIYCAGGIATAIAPIKSKSTNGLLWELPGKIIQETHTPIIPSTAGSNTIQVYELAPKSVPPLTESNACRSLLPLTLTLKTVQALPIPTIKEGSVACATGKVTLEATGCTPGMTYAWSANTGTAGAYVTISGATTATYAATTGVTYKAKCVVGTCDGTLGDAFLVTPAMAVFNVKANANTPVAQYQTLELKAVSSATTYAWSGPNGFTSTDQNPRIPDLTIAAAGTYTVTASESTCTATSTVAITINQVTDCNIKIKGMLAGVESYKFPAVKINPTATIALSIIDNVTPAYWNVSPATYKWTGPDGKTSDAANVIATEKGEYALQITRDGKQCEAKVILNGSKCGEPPTQPTNGDPACTPNGGIAAPVTGVTPLRNLKPGDEIFAGDFEARIITSTGSNGIFTGTAGVKVPYLKFIELSTTFINIQVNECYELMAGANNKLITVYDPTKELYDADKAIADIRDLANSIKDAIATTIDKDYPYIKKLKEDILKEVEANLPEDLKDKFSKTLDALEQAKKDYDACKKLTDNAAAKTCKADAEIRYKAEQEKLKDLEKEKDKIIDAVADIILLAVKQVGAEANTKIAPLKTTMENDESSLKLVAKPFYSKETPDQNYLIVNAEEFTAPSALTSGSSVKDLQTKFNKYQTSGFEFNVQDYALILFSKFQTKERTTLIGKAIKDNGKTLISKIAERVSSGEAKAPTVTFVKDELIFFLTQTIANKK